MVLNYIWIGFFIVALIVAIVRTTLYFLQQGFDISFWTTFTLADRDVFPEMVRSTFSSAEASITFSIYLIGIMTLWLGIMRIGEKGGAVNMIAWLFAPFFRKIFPDVPDKHPAMGSMMMNFCANMLGLDNAATPLGLKAMKDLQEINPKKESASDAQIMFLVLNTSGLTLVPISILGYRAAANAQSPAEIFLPLLLTTFFSTIAGLIAVSIVQRINLFNKIILAYLTGLSLLIGGLFAFLSTLPQQQMQFVTVFTGNFILFGFIVFFLFAGLKKKINIYETFIEGAKDGFQVAITVIPYLVAMLFAIGVFRASGALDFITDGIAWFFALLGFDTRFVDGLPTAFMKPLSGSGARGMMLEVFNNPNFGPDSFVGRLVSIVQGSTETTFYTIAVYYGAVGISRTRYTVTCGLIADLTAIVAAILLTYFFFG
ncbi:MAG: spore maturation protein [Bacteroidales bacterium]|nr:spore maturation protein [Bacteroidales bacterium]